MKKNFKNNIPAKKESCYYVDFDICTCGASENCDKHCVGKEACGSFVSENDFFLQMMDGKGELKQEQNNEAVKERRERIVKNLSLGKSKKQLKREQKLEDEKNGVGQGYALFDDERFKDLFKK